MAVDEYGIEYDLRTDGTWYYNGINAVLRMMADGTLDMKCLKVTGEETSDQLIPLSDHQLSMGKKLIRVIGDNSFTCQSDITEDEDGKLPNPFQNIEAFDPEFATHRVAAYISTNSYSVYQATGYNLDPDDSEFNGYGVLSLSFDVGSDKNTFNYIVNQNQYTTDAQGNIHWNKGPDMLETLWASSRIDTGFNGSGTDQGRNKQLYCYTSFPIFDTKEHANAYINSGAIEGMLNGNHLEPGDYPAQYYYRQIVYRYDKNMNNKTIIRQSLDIWEVPKSEKIYGYTTKAVPYNVHLETTASSMVHGTSYQQLDEGAGEEITTFTPNDYWMIGGEIVTDGKYYYQAVISKNFPIYESEYDAHRYRDGHLTEDDGIGGSGYNMGTTYPTGDDVSNTKDDISDNSQASVLSHVYVGNLDAMTQIAQKMYTLPEGYDNILDWVNKSMAWYGENPIELFIDCYYCPIDVSDFIISGEDRSIQFGSTNVELTVPMQKVIYNGKVKSIINQFISGVYNDFRDNELVHYYLYLPYAGIKELGANIYLNKILDVKCTYDLRSHNIKYYLCCDGNLVDTVETSLGVNFPLIATDQAGKAQQNISAIMSLASSTASAAVGSVGLANGLADGIAGVATTGGVIGGLNEAAKDRGASGSLGNALGLMSSVTNAVTTAYSPIHK